MDGEWIGWLIAGAIGICITGFVVWTVAVAALKAASYLIYVVPIVLAVAVAAGVVFAIVTAVWVLWGAVRRRR